MAKSEYEESSRICPECGAIMNVRTIESDCGGYVDEKYLCPECGYKYFVDGPDA